MSRAMIDAVANWASENGVSQSAAIRSLLEAALAQTKQPKSTARMAPRKGEPPGMERDSRGKAIPLKKRTKDDRERHRRAKSK